MQLASLALIALLAITGPPEGVASGGAVGDSASISSCVVTLIDQARVPSMEAGVLTELLVEEGQAVKAGDFVARIDDLEAQSAREIAAVETEIAAEDLDQKKVRRLQAESRGDRQLLETAQLESKMAELTLKLRRSQLSAADVKVARRRIESPLDGVVVERYRRRGEWLSPGEAIMYIVRMDRLRVEGFVPAADHSPDEIVGRDVEITVHLARGQTAVFRSVVSFASPLVENSGQYRIWADVENRREGGQWVMRPGLTADMRISLQ
ncbi:MAG: efflux RND transporter periplasmic adaptor subunit [Pirellulaceae bacterium]